MKKLKELKFDVGRIDWYWAIAIVYKDTENEGYADLTGTDETGSVYRRVRESDTSRKYVVMSGNRRSIPILSKILQGLPA